MVPGDLKTRTMVELFEAGCHMKTVLAANSSRIDLGKNGPSVDASHGFL